MFVHTHTCRSQEITHTGDTDPNTHTLDPERIIYKQDFKPFSLIDEDKCVNVAASAEEMKCG